MSHRGGSRQAATASAMLVSSVMMMSKRRKMKSEEEEEGETYQSEERVLEGPQSRRSQWEIVEERKKSWEKNGIFILGLSASAVTRINSQNHSDQLSAFATDQKSAGILS